MNRLDRMIGRHHQLERVPRDKLPRGPTNGGDRAPLAGETRRQCDYAVAARAPISG
jgi:hypothetical protein